MNLKGIPLLILFAMLALHGNTQVTIGSGIEPSGGALLDLKENNPSADNTTATKGLLLPRVKLTDLNNLFPMFTDDGAGEYSEGTKVHEDAAHTGLIVYNVNTVGCGIRPGAFTWTGDKWLAMTRLADDDISGFSFDRVRDSLALVSLYNSTGGPGWTDNTNWLSSRPVTEWYGITYIEKCANGKTEVGVTGIHMENNNLTGTLPDDLKNLANLTQLSLPVGRLSGNIPLWLSGMGKLQIIDLRSNSFTGAIPSGLGALTGLVILDLQDNQLTGTIPSEFGNLSGLRYLSLADNNQLTGAIPAELGSLAGLASFNIQNCDLSGTVPTTFGNLVGLVNLNLSGNQLSGTIPTQLGNLTKLRSLSFSSNLISGTIPSGLGNLTALEYSSLNDNQLTGDIPSSFSSLINLKWFSADHNRLSGEIPDNLLSVINKRFCPQYQSDGITSNPNPWTNYNDADCP